ncbi:DUF6531 domain-containing protein [Amycolatopsis sp. NPDC004368]
MSNPLVVQTQDSTKAYSGISLLESANGLAQGIESGDWAATAMGAVGTGLDMLSVAMDPFGAALAAGVGWLLEHVGPLKEALDGLTGNADQIKAQSETLQNVSKELGAVATDLTDSVNADLQSWTGAAADAYRARAQDLSNSLQAAAKGCEGAASGVAKGGEIVAAVRTLVRDTIAQIIGHLIDWALEEVASLGLATPFVLGQIATTVADTAAHITKLVTGLVKALKALAPLLKKTGALFEDVGKGLKGLKGGKVAPPPKTKGLSGTPEAPPVKSGGADSGGTKASGYQGTPKDYTPPPGSKGADDGTHTSGYSGAGGKDYTPPAGAKGADEGGSGGSGYSGSGTDFGSSAGKAGKSGDDSTHASSAGGGKGGGEIPPPTKTNDAPPAKETGDESTVTSGAGGGTPKGTDTTPAPRSKGPDSLGSGGKSVDESTPATQRCVGGDPVDLVTGEMVMAQTDLELPGVLSLVLERVHVSGYAKGRLFGRRWAATLDQRVEIDDDGIHYAAADGVVLHYPKPADSNERVLPSLGTEWPLLWDRETDVVLIGQPESGRTLAFPQHPTGVRPLAVLADLQDNRITFSYDERGVPTEIRHSGGYRVLVGSVETFAGPRIADLRLEDAAHGTEITVVSFGYDDGGRLTEVRDPQGRPMLLTYDAEDRVTGWVDRNGHGYRYVYGPDGRVVRTEGTGGFLASEFAYDRETRVTRMTDSLGHVTEYHFNELNQVVKFVDARGGVTETQYDGRGGVLAITDPLGDVVRAEQEDGRVSVVRPDGSSVQLVSETPGSRPTKSVGPDGSESHREYDNRGNVVADIDPDGSTTAYDYGEHGELLAVRDAAGTTRYETNAAGLTTAVIDPSGARVSIERDAFGRIVAVTDPLGAVARTGWTVSGLKAWEILPDGGREEWHYDGEDNLVHHRDRTGAQTVFEYGPFDEITARTDPSGVRYEFAYDTELRLTTVTGPQGMTWHYAYDAVGNLVSETDFNGSTTTYVHDQAGNTIERTNGAGQRIAYTYDKLGRVIRRVGDGVDHQLTYDVAGRLVSARSPESVVEYTYDRIGQVLTETVNGATTKFDYDEAGRVTGRVTPSGATSRWSYRDNGLPLALEAAGGGLKFSYDPVGREIARTTDAGAVLQQGYNTIGQVTQQVVRAGGRERQHRTFAYRADGFVLRTTDNLRGARSYDLDAAGRVKTVHAANWTEHYGYDAQGNLALAVLPGDDDVQGERVRTGTLVRSAGRTSYDYDCHGRVVRRVSRTTTGQALEWRYTWNAEDRLVRLTTPDGETWAYSYDPFGRRIAKRRLAEDGAAVSEMRFSWDGMRLAEQSVVHDGVTDVVTWDWAPGSHRVLAQTKRQLSGAAPVKSSFHTVVTDAAGTPTELVDAEGRIPWAATTTLWGTSVVTPGEEAGFPLRFPGQYHDAESGLNYNLNRYYNPSVGAYLTPDPLGLNPSPNNHAYVDNPLLLLDPLGLAPGCLGGKTARNGKGKPNPMLDSAARLKRKLGRKINGKQTPEYVYRIDERPPQTIANDGFQPWKPDGSLKVEEHVNNAHADTGLAAKHDSQFVSTGDYRVLHDPTLNGRPGDYQVYRIDPSKAGGQFHDVNAHFDGIGVNRPYPEQREWLFEGEKAADGSRPGIPADAVVGSVPLKSIQSHPDFKIGPGKVESIPGADKLDWQPLPPRSGANAEAGPSDLGGGAGSSTGGGPAAGSSASSGAGSSGSGGIEEVSRA